MEAGSTLTGHRIPDPVFMFGTGTSHSTSAVISKGPADLNPELGYQKIRSKLIPWLLTDGELDNSKRQVYEDLVQGSERFYGLTKILRVETPSLKEAEYINLLNYKDPRQLDEAASKVQEKDIAIALLNDSAWRFRVKATCDYRGLPSQIISSNVLKRTLTKGQDELRQYQNNLKNLAVEIYAKCGGVPWVLTRPLESRYFIGIAWIPLYEHYVFASVPFDFRGKPLYEKSVMKIFQKSAKDFKNCNISIIEEVLKKIEPDNYKVALHYHGSVFGLEDVFRKTLGGHCKEWVVLSIEKPKHPFFRLFSQSIKDNLNEKGICIPLDKRRCIISTTGLPHFNVRGTPQNLFVESISDLETDQMLQEAKDIYHLTQMNWASIRGYHDLPVTTLLPSNIATDIRDAHETRRELGLWTSSTPQMKPWSSW